MNRKLLLFDVDGTLLSYSNEMPESCVKAVTKAKENGHYVFVVTGRAKNRAIVGDIPVNGMVCGNGAYIEADGVVLQDRKLSLNQVKEIVDYLEAHQLDYFMEGNDGLYGSSHYGEAAIVALKKYGLPNPVIKEVYPEMVFPESMYIENITKINYILNCYQDYLDFKERFSDLKCLTWGGTGEAALFGDCALPEIDKSESIRHLIEYLGVLKEDIYAFGDAEVDIPMFQMAGTSICLGSGRAGAKEAADYVTDAVMDDGIAHALEHFKLI